MELRRVAGYRVARIGWTALKAFRRYRGLSRRERAGRPPSSEEWDAAHERTARELHDLAVELEGLFIKLCQLIGARADVLPEAYPRILGRFHDKVPPRPFASLRPGVERSLGRRLADVFAEVEETPLAAASLAQVHKAKLRSGDEVVLKIQYPEIARLVRIDLAILRRIGKWLERLQKLIDATALLEDTMHFLDLELDFELEARSTERIRASFADDERVRVPRVYGELCSRKLLVLEYLDGLPLTDMERLRKSEIDLKAFAETIAGAYTRMIFEDGFFQGDPHPGNLLALPGGVVGLLDFGLAKELPDAFGPTMAALFTRSMLGDKDGALEAARSLGFNLDELSPALLKKLVDETIGRRANPETGGAPPRSWHELSEEERRERRWQQRDPSRLQETRQHRAEIMELAEDSAKLRIPPHFALIGRTIMLLNGLSHLLAPGEMVMQKRLRAALASYAALGFQGAARE